MRKIDTFYTRIQNKHDIEANWDKVTNFIPLAGEIIVYDADENYNYSRIKIGDGITLLKNLNFNEGSVSDFSETDESSPAFIKNKPTEEDAMELLAEMDIIQPMADENGALYVDENNTIYVI